MQKTLSNGNSIECSQNTSQIANTTTVALMCLIYIWTQKLGSSNRSSMTEFKSSSEDLLKGQLTNINYKDCARTFAYLKAIDKSLALFIFLSSRNKLVTEALDTVVDSYYFQKNYVENGVDIAEVIKPDIIRSIVHCKRIWAEYPLGGKK